MNLNIFTDFADWFYEVTEPVKDFFITNARNPFLWVAIIIVVLVIFEVVYKKLHRD